MQLSYFAGCLTAEFTDKGLYMAYKNNRTKNRRRYRSRYRNAHNYRAKRSPSQTKAAAAVAVITFLIIASLVLIFTFGDQIYNWIDNALSGIMPATVDEASPTQIETIAPTQVQTEKPTQPPKPTEAPTVAQDEQFMSLLSSTGKTVDQLKNSQMIFVKTEGTVCTVYCYQKGSDGLWSEAIGPFSGYIGSQGASTDISPYESKTPIGTFNIEFAFGTKYDPGTKLEYYQVDIQTRWITDPNSINYNRFVEDVEYQDWEYSQWLYEYIYSYPYAVVFDYNRNPVDKSQGCAKFLHVSSDETDGGIGISEENLLSVLYWLDPGLSPTISIF